MEWLTLIISNLVSLLTGLGGTILYFRPKLKEANANALKAQAESQNYVYDLLTSRIEQLEKSHNEQYNAQNKVIETLRAEILKLTEEKFERDKEMIQLKGENQSLRERVDSLEKEVQAYRNK